MSGTTSVPAIAFTDKGFVAPQESAIVEGVGTDTNAAFNNQLNLDPSTPQGQWIASTSAMLGDNYDQQVALYNGVDPAHATGRLQDAIARIYFLERYPAQSTVIQVACIGALGVVIPLGASVQDAEGNIYLCITPGIIPTGGTITLSFASAFLGPVPIPGAVTIYQTIPQWDRATFVSGELGNLAESRSAFEFRRQATIAGNAAGFLPAISGAVGRVSGVLDWYATENPTAAAVNVRGYYLAAHSLYVAVTGGTDGDVAGAIWTKKNPGCAYNGNTTVTVTDTNSGYSAPQPTYPVTFERPIPTAICFEVDILDNPGIPSDAVAQIQKAIGEAFAGHDGGQRARIASTIFAARFYAPVALLGPWAQIVQIRVGSGGVPDAAFVASITDTVMTVTAVASITFIGTSAGTNEITIASPSGTVFVGYNIGVTTGVPVGTQILWQKSGTPGGAGVYVTNNQTTTSAASLTGIWIIAPQQFVFGGTTLSGLVASGTMITSQASGTPGGIGTYNISQTQTIASEDMLSVAPILNDVTMGIDQQPVYGGFDVNVEIQMLPS